MKLCTYNGCNRKHAAKGYCKAHHRHVRLYGAARDLSGKENQFIEHDNYYQIIVYSKKRKPLNLDIRLSKEDYEKCKEKRWCFNGQYVKEATSKYVLYLHRFITNDIQDKMVIDHINRNKLDNRRENIRVVTKAENNRNK